MVMNKTSKIEETKELIRVNRVSSYNETNKIVQKGFHHFQVIHYKLQSFSLWLSPFLKHEIYLQTTFSMQWKNGRMEEWKNQ